LQFAKKNRIVARFLLISFLSASGNAISQRLNDSIIGSDSSFYNHPVKYSKFYSSAGYLPKKENVSSRIKSSNISNQLKALDLHGNVTGGYEYGVLSYVYGNEFPAKGFRSEGNITFNLLKIPLVLTYNYTSIKNVIGLNNYFRISYDASKYKEQLKDQAGNKQKLLNDKISGLQDQQQILGQKIEFYKYLERNPDYTPLTTSGDSLSEEKDSFKTDLNISNYDSLNATDTNQYTSIAPDSSYLDSLKVKQRPAGKDNSIAKKDSISRELNGYVAKYDSISNEINEVKTQIDNVSKYQEHSDKIDNPYLTKAQQFLSHIKKFEIGLCNPHSSVFLINNIPLQGINVEYEKANKYITLAYGTTVNNLLYQPGSVEGIIQGTRNYYNYFDFGNLEAGRKILMVKGGTGTKESTHIFLGALIGKGKVDYMLAVPDNSATKESNLVLEVDAKYNFSPKVSTELILGKSSLKNEDVSTEQLKSAMNEIFSNYRSYALLSKTNFLISKTKTNITVIARWIDPYFKSMGLGFLRSDNFRYELKAEQSITKKIKYTLSFRKEEDNLLQLYNYKNILYSINNSLNIKITRKLNIRLIYIPLFRKLRYDDRVITDRNQIATGVISWLHKAKKFTAQFNSLYSIYQVTGDSSNINFQNLAYTQQFIFKTGFKSDLNVTWFKNNLSDTLGNDTYLGLLEFGFVSKKHNSISIGGKIAYKNNTGTQYGFSLKSLVRVYKNLSAEAEISKIIIGDYYNSFNQEKIKSFPYYCKAQLSFNF
jgi:hypothetical protein